MADNSDIGSSVHVTGGGSPPARPRDAARTNNLNYGCTHHDYDECTHNHCCADDHYNTGLHYYDGGYHDDYLNADHD